MTSTMRNLTATICLTLAVLLGSGGVGFAQDLRKGLAAYNSDDYATALRELKPLAEQGEAKAQKGMGGMYRRGKGVTQDYKTAMKWFRKSAEQGNAEAQWGLGGMYRFRTRM